MKYINLPLQIVCLYAIFSMGQIIQQVMDLPIPGSIIGMMLLFCALQLNILKKEWLSLGSSFLLKNLPILFIPATVGVIDYLHLFKGIGLITIFIALISTIFVMVSSSFISDVLIAKGKEVKKDKGISL